MGTDIVALTQRQALARVAHEAPAWQYRSFAVAHHLLSLMLRRDWQGVEHIPASGAALVCINHLSNLDPFVMFDFFVYNGRWPNFFMKSGVFTIPGIARMMRRAGQIPVYRGTPRASEALVIAKERLQQGRLVALYPEGRLTQDPDEWPMAIHTGAARLALDAHVPIIPIAHWGVTDVMRGDVPHRKLRVRGRPWVRIRCGKPLDLSFFGEDSSDPVRVRAASRHIGDTLARMVEELRGCPAPKHRWLPRLNRRVPRAAAIS